MLFRASLSCSWSLLYYTVVFYLSTKQIDWFDLLTSYTQSRVTVDRAAYSARGTWSDLSFLLPRDAMHKRGLCRRAVAGCHDRVSCRDGWRYGYSFYGMQIGSRTQAFKWYNFQWHWVTPNPEFKLCRYSTLTLSVFEAVIQRHTCSYNGNLNMSYSRV